MLSSKYFVRYCKEKTIFPDFQNPDFRAACRPQRELMITHFLHILFRFTRVQRITCCITFLYLWMCVNAMWFGVAPEGKVDIYLGFSGLSYEEILIGIISSLIVFPINMLFVIIFRKTKTAHSKVGMRSFNLSILVSVYSTVTNNAFRKSIILAKQVNIRLAGCSLCTLPGKKYVQYSHLNNV